MQQIIDCFAAQLFDWSSALGFTSNNSVLDFVASLHYSSSIDNSVTT
jgi:hypothetical protein